MSRRVGAWTLGQFVLFNVMTLLEIIGLVVALRGQPLVGGLIVFCAAMVVMALGFRSFA